MFESNIIRNELADKTAHFGFEFEPWPHRTNDWSLVAKKEVSISFDYCEDLLMFLNEYNAVASIDEQGPYIILGYWEE